MKTHLFARLTASLAAILTPHALAIEGSADNVPPPPAAKAPVIGATPDDASKEPTGFLGVVAADVPAMLAEHLDIKPNDGVLVRALMPDGPAAKAGVALHDIITRVADQPVTSSRDLTKTVAKHQPGATIHLHLIHRGEPKELDVTLGTRPASITGMNDRPLDPLNLDGMPKELADRIRGTIEENLGKLEMNGEPAMEDGDPHRQDAMREMRNHIQDAMDGLNKPLAPGKPNIDLQQGAAIRLMDEQGSIELKAQEGGREVTLRDKDNNVTWNGPWDTDQDKAAAPDAVRQRMNRLNLDSKFEGNGLRFHLRPGHNPNDAK
jgi:membrane-associated protease RseP (regulator of RpoE activity)